MAEDMLVLALERRALIVIPKRVAERRRERDRADAVFRLRSPDAKDALEQIDVAPAELPKLVPADAGKDERQEDRACLLVRERLENAANLRGLEDAPAALRQLRMLGACRGVRVDELLTR